MLPILITAALIAAPQASPPTNTKCPVGKSAVDKTVAPVTVAKYNKQYYVCCGSCAQKLRDHPEKYLDEQGNPKTTK